MRRGTSDLNIMGRTLMEVWMRPLAQRACWVLKAVISMGNSAGHSISGRYLNFHPAIWER
jgi:hypothetical protein